MEEGGRNCVVSQPRVEQEDLDNLKAAGVRGDEVESHVVTDKGCEIADEVGV